MDRKSGRRTDAGRGVPRRVRVVSAQEGSDYEVDLASVIEETEDLSRPLGRSERMDYPLTREWSTITRRWFTTTATYRREGVHTNQAENLWSLLQPLLAKFRGLSKQGLEQAAQAYGFLQSMIDALINEGSSKWR